MATGYSTGLADIDYEFCLAMDNTRHVSIVPARVEADHAGFTIATYDGAGEPVRIAGTLRENRISVESRKDSGGGKTVLTFTGQVTDVNTASGRMEGRLEGTTMMKGTWHLVPKGQAAALVPKGVSPTRVVPRTLPSPEVDRSSTTILSENYTVNDLRAAQGKAPWIHQPNSLGAYRVSLYESKGKTLLVVTYKVDISAWFIRTSVVDADEKVLVNPSQINLKRTDEKEMHSTYLSLSEDQVFRIKQEYLERPQQLPKGKNLTPNPEE